jgi:hypothetical protein
VQGFLRVGGTGLEPVTPSLSIRGGRSGRFAVVRSGAWLSEIDRPSERLSERERTSSVAIVATRLPASSAGGPSSQRASAVFRATFLRPATVDPLARRPELAVSLAGHRRAARDDSVSSSAQESLTMPGLSGQARELPGASPRLLLCAGAGTACRLWRERFNDGHVISERCDRVASER